MHSYFKDMSIKYNNKFTYLEDTYNGVNNPFTFLCPTHGALTTTPNKHRKVGCKECNKDAKIMQTLKTFKEKANILHHNKYNYSKAIYTTNRNNITITCLTHGDFQQTPSNHLKGHGCKACQYTTLAEIHKKPQSTFIAECMIVHATKYTYEKTSYTNTNSKIIVTCPIHGDFEQWAGHHLRGVGCPTCSPGGFNYDKPGILYYLSINQGECYKIGITNLSVNERYSNSELACIEIIDEVFYLNGKDAYDKEQAILRYYKSHKYTTSTPLKSGNTELFSLDLLTLKENHEITSIRELKT